MVEIAPEPTVEDHLPGALRLATILTGSPVRGGDVATAALARAQRHRRELGRSDFPEGYVRAMVVTEFLSGADRTPSDHTGPRGLSRRQRAGLVLRVYEQLTYAEIAGILDRPAPAVSAEVAAAAAMLQLDPNGVPFGPQGYEALREISELAEHAPSPATVRERLASAAQRSQRRRSRGLLVAGVVALVGLLTAFVPSVVVPRLPAPTRGPDDWFLIHQVKAPRGWTVLDRTISADWESSTLRPDGRGRAQNCTVTVGMTGRGADPRMLAGDRLPARVKGHPGFFNDGHRPESTPFLAWEYSPGGWAVVTCPAMDSLDKALLARLAGSVRFRRTPLNLPFSLGDMPPDYRLDFASETLAFPAAEVILAKKDLRPGDFNLSLTLGVRTPAQGMAPGRAIRLSNGPATIELQPYNPRLCMPKQDLYVCLSAYWPLGDWPEPAPILVEAPPALVNTAEGLDIASSLRDRTTWFAARNAIPR